MIEARDIDGATVCVTGASSGFGRLIAERLGARGAHVFLMGRNETPMLESAEKIAAAVASRRPTPFSEIGTIVLMITIELAKKSTGSVTSSCIACAALT